MSSEIPKQSYKSEFFPSYPKPATLQDQRAYRLQLEHDLERDFPETAPALEYALDNLVQPADGYRRLALAAGNPVDPNNIAEPGEGYSDDGQLPLATAALIGGLYALTGAEAVKEQDEKFEGAQHDVHEVIRRGNYLGDDVYFVERTFFQLDNGVATKTRISLSVAGEEEVERRIGMNQEVLKIKAARLAIIDQQKAAEGDTIQDGPGSTGQAS